MSQPMTARTAGEQGGSLRYVLGVSIIAAQGGFLLGYDTAVISGAIGFLQRHFDLNATWTGWAVSSALAGCIIGVLIAGSLSDKFGRKKVLIFSAVMFLVSAIGTALPRNITEFVIFRMIGGVGVGASSMAAPVYIAEISPSQIRGRMVTVYQFAIVIGIQLVFFVNYLIAGLGDEAWNESLGWRWMFGSESLPALLFLLLLFFVPESPRWLTEKGRPDEALHVLTRAGGSVAARQELKEIELSIEGESGSLSQLFQRGLRTALVIGVALAMFSQFTGINAVLYYAPEIFKTLGSGTSSALLQTVAVGAVNLIATFIAYWTVDRLGRKPLMVIGAVGMILSLWSFGLAFYFRSTGWWSLIFILGFIASFALSIGPVGWVVLSEIFPTRLRGRAMAIATVCIWIANFIVSQTFPMLNENPRLLEIFRHGFPFWVYGLSCLGLLIFVLFFVPETRGKTLEEIERLWQPQS